jgi:hypothetical protein
MKVEPQKTEQAINLTLISKTQCCEKQLADLKGSVLAWLDEALEGKALPSANRNP